jgi:hypothetical protein
MERKQQQSLNEAVKRVVLGEAPTHEEKMTETGLKKAMSIVDKAIAQLHKKFAKDVKEYGLKDVLPKGGGWKRKKNKNHWSHIGATYMSKDEVTIKGGDWVLSAYWSENHSKVMISYYAGGENGYWPLETFDMKNDRSPVLNWFDRIQQDVWEEMANAEEDWDDED